jgi:pimeloyl-ACP methyl ester carboxylesterase
MEFVTSPDGTRISWYTEGQGPPLLLVHGTTADHTRWDGVTGHLGQQFTVHAMDRRGRGESTDSDKYVLQREAEDVAAVIEELGERVAVLGHSYGAVCALEGALLTSGIERLVLYEPPIPTGIPMYPTGLPDRMQSLIEEGLLEAAVEMFFKEVVNMPDDQLVGYRQLPAWQRRVRLSPTIPRELAIDRAYSFKPEKYGEMQTPTLLLLGGDSPAMFQQAGDAVHQALPNSTVTPLPGQQHIAMDTNPELFLSEVRGFLTG